MSDILASRTIWYAMDENMLIASTSQRAIISFLGEFRLNRSAVAWSLFGDPGAGNLLGRADLQDCAGQPGGAGSEQMDPEGGQ